MPKNRIILVLGALIALLPILGFPHSWESAFQILAGLSIVILSVWATIDRKLSLKAKAHLRQARKVVAPGMVPELTSDAGKRITDFYPKTGQQGRRMTDMSNVNHPDLAPPALDKIDEPLN